MKLNHLEIRSFRNISSLELSPCGGVNVIYGDNAQGKTNLVEGIWLFTGNSSFRGAKPSEMIQFQKEEAALSLSFSDRQREQTAEIVLSGRRKVLLNHVEEKSLSALKGVFYAVVFSPSHLSFVKEGPKNRRRFLDIAISEIRPQYEEYLQLYERLLEQRNALLRNASQYRNLEQNMEIWDLQLAKAGTILSIYRNDYVKKLQKLAAEIYRDLSRRAERFEIRYESTVFEDIAGVQSYEEEHVERYLSRLRDSFAIDVRQGFTSAGVHRDDLDIRIDGKPARIYGSQGQQRSVVITLKLAEALLLKKAVGENPVMLLDDVMSELDVSRQSYILNHLTDMQVFITCCDVSNTLKLENGMIFRMEQGVLSDQTQRG